MARIIDRGNGRVSFRCQGCGENHEVNVDPAKGEPCWSFNGNFEKPTFSPSVLVRSGHHIPGQAGKDCWCTFEKKTGETTSFKCRICHCFVVNGMIQFLRDCTHELAGKTLELPEV